MLITDPRTKNYRSARLRMWDDLTRQYEDYVGYFQENEGLYDAEPIQGQPLAAASGKSTTNSRSWPSPPGGLTFQFIAETPIARDRHSDLGLRHSGLRPPCSSHKTLLSRARFGHPAQCSASPRYRHRAALYVGFIGLRWGFEPPGQTLNFSNSSPSNNV